MAGPEDRTIGGYRVGTRIRTARHVSVFAGEDRLGRRIEITCYNSEALRDRTGKEVFFEEARRTASLHHENLCLLVDAGEEGPVWFTTSLAPEGPSLREILDRGGALAEERVALVARSVADALAYLDRAGLRHGDLRPETIFLASGLVLLAPRRLIPLSLAERDPRYLAPEEIRIEGADLRTDLFCLGEILYETLTGAPAIPSQTPEEALARIEAGPSPLPPEASPALCGLIAALLSRRPEDRPADPGTIARILSGEIVLAVPGRPAPDAPPTSPAPAGAPAGFAAAPSPVAAPPPVAPRPPARRTCGRLTIPTEKEPASLDLLEDSIFLTAGEDGRPRLLTADPGQAVARVDRTAEGDLLYALPDREPRVRLNGSLVDQHRLDPGDRIGVGEYEVTYGEGAIERPPAAPPPPRPKPPLLLALGAAGLCVAVLLLGLLRVGSLKDEGADTLGEVVKARQALAAAEAARHADTSPKADFKAAAERAWRAAEERAREKPDSYDGNRTAFAEVRRLYPGTLWAYLAEREIEKIEGRRQEALAVAYGDLTRKATLMLEADQLNDASLLYRNFAADHPDTLFADRAQREAQVLGEMLDTRFSEDMRRAEDAAASQDFGVAIDILAAVERYGSPEQRDRAAARAEEIRRLLRETQITGGEPPTPPGPVEVPPPPGPEEPPGPVEPPPAVPPPDAGEAEASRLFDEARQQMERQRFEEALRRLDKLEAAPLSGTRFALDHANEIAKMRALARLERDGFASLFHGQVQVKRERDVLIRYTFETAAEEEDWTFIKPFADPRLGSFDHREEGMHGKGVGALVHSAVFEATTLRMYARVQAVLPQDFGMAFFEPEEMMRYFLFTVQNRFFTIGKDRQPLEENVVWVFGGGAWSATDPGNIGFVKKAQSPQPPVSAGEWLDLESLFDGNRIVMTIKKAAPITGSSLGDDGYRFPALRPAVYVLGSEAVFKEIVLTGTLEDGWLRGVMKRERDRLTR
jgi:hypothetical protein